MNRISFLNRGLQDFDRGPRAIDQTLLWIKNQNTPPPKKKEPFLSSFQKVQ